MAPDEDLSRRSEFLLLSHVIPRLSEIYSALLVMATPPPLPPLPDTIVCLPINEWSGLPVNSHHLMREAASRGYRVLYVDPIGLRRPGSPARTCRS